MSERYGYRVLYLSGPIEPPWTRADKNLVRGIATHLQRYRACVMTHEGVVLPDLNVDTAPLWGPRVGGNTPLGRRMNLFTHLIETTGTELVHLFWPAEHLVAQVVKTACRIRGLPVVHTLVRPPRSLFGLSGALAGSPVVCLTEQTQERLHREGIRNTVHIPTGIDAGTPVPEGDKAAIRRRYRIPLDRPVVIYAGDYAHSKAARTFAATMPRVLRSVPCHFVFACRIRNPEDTDEEARIQEAITADGIADHVTFLNEVNNLRELLSIAAVQVFPADRHYEQMEMPMVLLEGMAEGVPTVVVSKPPLTELLHAGAAYGVPPGDPVSLAVPVVSLLRNADQARQLGEAGRKLVENRYNIAKVAARHEEMYDEILTRKNSRATGWFARI